MRNILHFCTSGRSDNNEYDIDLSNLGLTFFPISSLCFVGRIESLNISTNPITNLYDGLNILSGLRKLNISEIGLQKFLMSLFELTALEDLNLSKNPLQDLPEFSAKLHCLKKLNIADTELDSIPKSLARFPKLIELDIRDNNDLRQIPEEFFSITRKEGDYLHIYVTADQELINSIRKYMKLYKGSGVYFHVSQKTNDFRVRSDKEYVISSESPLKVLNLRY